MKSPEKLSFRALSARVVRCPGIDSPAVHLCLSSAPMRQERCAIMMALARHAATGPLFVPSWHRDDKDQHHMYLHPDEDVVVKEPKVYFDVLKELGLDEYIIDIPFESVEDHSHPGHIDPDEPVDVQPEVHTLQ